jgi:N-acetylneuraminic acid mutarotase
MSEQRPSAEDDGLSRALKDLELGKDEVPAFNRVRDWIGRGDFATTTAPSSRTPIVARIAIATAVIVIVAAFGAFNLTRIGKHGPPITAIVGTPSPSGSPFASPSPTPLPTPTPRTVSPLPATAPPQGRWQQLPPMATPRKDFTATVLTDGQVLIAGGQYSSGANGGQATAQVEIFNPSTGKLAPAAQMGVARAGQTATLLPDGRVLVAGGYTQLGSQALASAEIYDPATGAWSSTGSLNAGRTQHAAVLLASGQVLVVGGGAYPATGISPHGSSPAMLAAETFNPASGTWATVAMPALDRPVHPTATLLANGRVLVVGGQYMWNSPDESQERSELYDPGSNTWSAVPPDTRSGARQFQSATLLPSGQVLVAGGMHDLTPIGSASLYDPTTNSWAELPNMSENRCGQGAVLLSTGRVLLVGSGCWDQQSAGVEEYDPASYRWFRVAPLSAPRGFVVAVAAGADRVIALGGTAPAGAPTGAVELFSIS